MQFIFSSYFSANYSSVQLEYTFEETSWKFFSRSTIKVVEIHFFLIFLSLKCSFEQKNCSFNNTSQWTTPASGRSRKKNSKLWFFLKKMQFPKIVLWTRRIQLRGDQSKKFFALNPKKAKLFRNSFTAENVPVGTQILFSGKSAKHPNFFC